jgi:hypothetical protein
MAELHEDLICQLYMRRQIFAKFRSYGSSLLTLEEIVLSCGRGMYCRNDRWRGIRRGPLHNCFQNASHLALSYPDRFVYVEGYAVRPDPTIVVGDHAWVLDRQDGHSVIDPTWRGTKGSAYLGIPFRTEYLSAQLGKHKIYGLLDAYWARWPLLHLPVEEWLHEDVVIPDFEVPEDLDAWYELKLVGEVTA